MLKELSSLLVALGMFRFAESNFPQARSTIPSPQSGTYCVTGRLTQIGGSQDGMGQFA